MKYFPKPSGPRIPIPYIFVFGSNEAGVHGAGAARYAFDHFGASWGYGEGISGDSYALPTKDHNIRTLGPHGLHVTTQKFIKTAQRNPEQVYYLTPVGTGLAGLGHEEMAAYFEAAPFNVVVPRIWEEHLPDREFIPSCFCRQMQRDPELIYRLTPNWTQALIKHGIITHSLINGSAETNFTTFGQAYIEAGAAQYVFKD